MHKLTETQPGMDERPASPFFRITVDRDSAMPAPSFQRKTDAGDSILNLEESSIVETNGGDSQEAGSARPTSKQSNADQRGSVRSEPADRLETTGLKVLLDEARKAARTAIDAETHARRALYIALGRSYDIALLAAKSPEVFAARMVFGDSKGEAELSEYASVLSLAREENIEFGELESYLRDQDDRVRSILDRKR